MSTNAKTVDNLGPQLYTQYEDSKGLYDENLIRDSDHIASQTTVDVFEPIMQSEYYILFGLENTQTPWGEYERPPNYNSQKKRLFTHKLAPKFGPEDVVNNQIDRVETKIRDFDPLQGKSTSNRTYQDVQKEGSALISVLKDINTKNDLIDEINNNRFRYGRG